MRWAAVAVIGIALAVTSVVAVRHWREAPAAPDPMQFAVAPPAGTQMSSAPIISPDGRMVAFTAIADNATTLYVRPLAALAARPLARGTITLALSWSPDSRFLAFIAEGQLKKMALDGSPSVTLGSAQGVVGIAWTDGGILLGSANGPLRVVSPDGGALSPATTLRDGDVSHRWPAPLPRDRHVLYWAQRGNTGRLEAVAVGNATVTDLGESDTSARYTSGHLLYVQDGTLMARPFDPSGLRFTGDPLPVAQDVVYGIAGSTAGGPGFSVADTNTLAIWAGQAAPSSRLTWTDRSGQTLGTIGEPGNYTNLAISPDGRHVAASLNPGAPANQDIWLFDLARDNTARRLTFDPANEADPAFSPDGTQVLFNSARAGPWSLYRRAADGSGQDELIVKANGSISAPDWSRDGRFIIYQGPGSPLSDLWVLPTTGDRTPFVFLQSPFWERTPAFSPDGRWVAYESDASGSREIYVRAFPSGGGEFKISRDGGRSPRWRGDGRELFFITSDGTMMAAGIDTVRGLTATVPKALFPTSSLIGTALRPWAVTPDGQRFLIRVADQRPSDRQPMTIILNWPGLIARRSE